MNTTKINHSTIFLNRATPKTYNFAQGKQGKTKVIYQNICEYCGAAGRLLAFNLASYKRHLCRDCAGKLGMI